jgi:hypothetical protein
MSDRDVTMAMCPHCEQPVQPSLHTTVQCLDNMRNQRDEAREVAAGLLSHLEASWAFVGNAMQLLKEQRKAVTHATDRFYPWLGK